MMISFNPNTPSANSFEFSDDNKRYHTYNYFLRHKFGRKVFKVSLNAGFTCPNRDGTIGVGGCTYCSAKSSGDFAGDVTLSLREQFEQVRDKMHKKWEDALYIAYFQAGTNTYAPIERLREMFTEVLTYPDVVGLSIATRADCLSEEICDLLFELSRRTYLVVELGLQTIHDKTAEKINRGHLFKEFLAGYEMLRRRGINVCVHLINGLPNETREMMLETAREVNRLCPHEVKLHLLHVLRGTVLCEQFERGEFCELSQSEYVSIICDQLEVFSPKIVIGRITGDGASGDLVAPLWSLKKFCVMNDIDKEMALRQTTQGAKAEKL